MVSPYGPKATIVPEYEPRLFLRIFGEIDKHRSHPENVLLQEQRIRAWDAAIEFAVLRQPIQQPVLTHSADSIAQP